MLPYRHQVLTTLLAVANVLAGPIGCAGDEAGVEPTPFALELGTWDRNLGTFTPLPATSVQPLISGFQGLLFVNLALLTTEDIAPRQRGRVSVELPGLGDSYEFTDNQIYFEAELLPDGTEVLVVPSFRIPFELTPAELDGQPVVMTATVGIGTDRIATVGAEFELRDASNCIHLPTDEIVCE